MVSTKTPHQRKSSDSKPSIVDTLLIHQKAKTLSPNRRREGQKSTLEEQTKN